MQKSQTFTKFTHTALSNSGFVSWLSDNLKKRVGSLCQVTNNHVLGAVGCSRSPDIKGNKYHPAQLVTRRVVPQSVRQLVPPPSAHQHSRKPGVSQRSIPGAASLAQIQCWVKRKICSTIFLFFFLVAKQ